MLKSFFVLIGLLMVSITSSAQTSVPICSDVFPAAITAPATPPDVLTLPPFPFPNDGALNLGNNESISLGSGPIYYTGVNTGNNVEIAIDGPTIIFVQGSAAFGNNNEINNPGNPADLVIIVYGTISVGNNTNLNGIIYSAGTVALSNNTVINGAVTAVGSAGTHPNTVVNYDPDAVANADFHGLCDSSEPPTLARLVAEYRMDSCEWIGEAGEVLDGSGNDLHGSVQNEAQTTADGWIERAGLFNSNANQFIRIPHNPLLEMSTGNQVSVSMWIKQTSSQSGWITLLSKSDRSYTMQLSNGETPRFTIHDGSFTGVNANHTIQIEQWYHLLGTFDGDTVRLYVDGVLQGENSGVGQMSDASGYDLAIGENLESRNRYFDGFIDEVKIYDGALSSADAENIYSNESEGLNWDGSEREPVICTPQLSCVNDDFNRAELGDDWTATHTSGNFGNPRIVNNRFRLTDASGNVATAATFQRLFPSAGNLITLEFDYFAYGGSGADGIAVALSDAGITPAPGGYGGSLGYANRCGIAGFAGGWLGIGLDTYGNYANGNECRNGRLPGTSGRVRNAVGLRGSGSGQSGYRFIDGTNSLSPTVRTGAANVSHRYRITIDSQTAGESWVTIKRRVSAGGDFEALVGPVDVLTTAGQAAVPANLLLTLTGSTGGANDNHEIDNLEICALSMNPIEDSIRYFRIEHSGEGLTCRAEPVTVKACANENCSELYSGNVTVRLLPNNSSGTYWMDGGNERTFSGGEATFLLRRTVEGDVAVGLTNSSPAASGVTRCVRAGQEGSCVINFADVGLEIDPIPTQIAGRPSDQGDSSTTQIHVVRTDDATGACIPALSDQTLTADFSYLNPEASQALDNNEILIEAHSSSTLTAVNASQSVDLAFDTEGIASFTFTSQDAGRHHLQVRLDIPVTDRQGDTTTETLTRTRPSNAFVVRPLAVFADASDNPNARVAEDDAFQVAGDNFALNFATVGWTSALDNHDDGQWDACGAATLDDPNTAVRVPAWDLGQPGATLVAPADGEHPGLDFADTNVQIPHGSDQIEVDTRYDEIGIIQLHESVYFLGEAVMVCSPHIGRFIPDHFAIISGSVTAACTAGNTPFTYYDEDGFNTAFTMQALNAAGEITQNYTADFARFDLTTWSNYDFAADDLPSGLALMDGANPPSGDWHQGVANVTATHMVTRQGPVNPATLTVTARPVDTDGVTTPERMAVHTEITELRYGRLELHNAHGPEILPLTVPLLIRYYHDGAFRRNTADACTEVQLSCLGWEPHGLVDYDHNAAHMENTAPGAIDLTLDPPGANNTGHVNLDMDLSVDGCDRPWLQYNWTGHSPKYDENPTARATFGIRRNRYVDIRELY
jgi:MSHA biogenesis protein MshQ